MKRELIFKIQIFVIGVRCGGGTLGFSLGSGRRADESRGPRCLGSFFCLRPGEGGGAAGMDTCIHSWLWEGKSLRQEECRDLGSPPA